MPGSTSRPILRSKPIWSPLKKLEHDGDPTLACRSRLRPMLRLGLISGLAAGQRTFAAVAASQYLVELELTLSPKPRFSGNFQIFFGYSQLSSRRLPASSLWRQKDRLSERRISPDLVNNDVDTVRLGVSRHRFRIGIKPGKRGTTT